MTASADRPTPPANWRLALLGLVWALLTVFYYQPPDTVLDAKLDPSIFGSYAYLTAHGFQYGADVVPMAGPLGFVMYGYVYSGELFWTRTLLGLLASGIFAGFLLWFFLQQRSALRLLWLAAHLVLTTLIEDLSVAWTLLLAGFFLLQPVPSSRHASVLASCVLAALALFKGTHLMLSLATVAVVLAVALLRRDSRQALRLATSYGAALVGFWLLAGQNPLNLPRYLLGAFHLAQGYNDAMAIAGPPDVVIRGIAVALGFTAVLGVSAWRIRGDWTALGRLALLGGFSFVMWKHGFVRADGHVYIFFSFVAVAAITWYLVAVPTGPWFARGFPRFAFVALLALVAGAVFAGREPDRPAPAFLATRTATFLRDRLVHLATLRTAQRHLDARLEAQRAYHALPAITERVGRDTVDLLGVEQGVILLNRLNYHPRPMGGGAYNAYNRHLMELNRDFFRDPARRPRYTVVKLHTVDYRLVGQDDALALQDVLHLYRPVLAELGYLLLEARRDPPPLPTPRPVARQSLRFGESIAVPSVSNGEVLLARFQLPMNALGRARAFVYRAPLVFAQLDGDDLLEPADRRLVPVMAEQPFLLSPGLETTGDFLSLYTDAPGKTVHRIQLTTRFPDLFAEDLEVEFFSLPRPPAEPLPPLAQFLHTPVETVTLPEELGGPRAFRSYSLHPPASFAWNLVGDEREFHFTYGLLPEATAAARTNGVTFVVETRTPEGHVAEIFRRHLDPVPHAADRPPQTARLALPLVPRGTQLVLRTEAGPFNDSGWDWSYVTDLKFVRGPYSLEQFPGFSTTPAAVEAGNASAVEIETGRVFLLHAPGLLRFALTGREQKLSLAFGLLPGSYTGEAGTDGADFFVELQRADGTVTGLLHATLRPRTTEADRGPQERSITLPAATSGDQLIVRTGPGPAGDSSWDWTYLSRLDLR